MLNNIPQFFIEKSDAYMKFLELSNEFPNDSEFGRAARKFIRDVQDGKVYLNSTKELDNEL